MRRGNKEVEAMPTC